MFPDMKAVIYCRISRDPSGDLLGVQRQEADCRKLCDDAGLDVHAVHVDDDTSAYSGKPRPGYVAALDDLRERRAAVLVAWHPDRITRQPRELEDLIDLLDEVGATVRTVQSGELDLSTPSGRMAARIVGAVARHESEHKSVRLRRKHLELAEAGRPNGGARSFGYGADWTIRESEARIIREVAGRILAGEPIRPIVKDLRERSVATVNGQPWKPAGIRRLMISARIAGLRSHRGSVVGPAVWPPVIDTATHERLRAILTDPARDRGQGKPPKLMTGLLFCGLCGHKMTSQPKKSQKPGAPRLPSWRCPQDIDDACGKVRISGPEVEDTIVAAAHERLLDTEGRPKLVRADDAELLAELATLDERRAELAELWAAGDIAVADWRAATTALDARRASTERALADHAITAARAVQIDNGAEMVVTWADLDTERRRIVLQSVIERVVVAPAVWGRNFFDGSRMTIEWVS